MLLLVLKDAKKTPNGKWWETFLKPWFIDNIDFAKKLWVKLLLSKFSFSQTSSFNRISIKIRIFAKKFQN